MYYSFLEQLYFTKNTSLQTLLNISGNYKNSLIFTLSFLYIKKIIKYS